MGGTHRITLKQYSDSELLRTLQDSQYIWPCEMALQKIII
jgi:hypothetical protein